MNLQIRYHSAPECNCTMDTIFILFFIFTAVIEEVIRFSGIPNSIQTMPFLSFRFIDNNPILI